MAKIGNTALVPGAEHHRYSFGQYILDVDRGALLKDDTDIPLRPKCFEVLNYLVTHHGLLVSKRELLDTVWAGVVVTDGSLTQCLIQIRKALGDTKKEMIRTIPRRGFLFDIPVTVYDPGETPEPNMTHRPLLDNRRPSRWSVGAAIVLALATAATWWAPGRQGIAMDPDNADLQMRLAQYYLGMLDEDNSQRHLGHILYEGGHYDEARQEMRYASTLNPGFKDELNWLIGLSWILQQQCDKAEAIMQQLPDSARRDQGMAMIYYARTEQAKFDAAIESLLADSGFDSSFYLAEIFAFQGEFDESFRWLNEATDKILNADPLLRNGSEYRIMVRSPFLKPMHDDKRWSEWQANTEKRVAQNGS